MPIAEIVTGLSGIKAALDILKGAKDLKGVGAADQIHGLQAALIDAQRGLIAADQAHAVDIDRIRQLEGEMRASQAQRDDLARYELKDLGWGAFAYMLKPNLRGSEPPHWACANCYKKGEIAIIQHIMLHQVGQRWVCPSCKNQIGPKEGVIRWL